MTVTHIYHDLPAELRGSKLESHDPNNWPRQWTTPDADQAMRVRVALGHIITASGIQGFTIDVTADTNATTITLNRTLTP